MLTDARLEPKYLRRSRQAPTVELGHRPAFLPHDKVIQTKNDCDHWGIENCALKQQVDRRNTFFSFLLHGARRPA